MKRRSEQHSSNIGQRGPSPSTKNSKEDTIGGGKVGPVALGILLFVVLGSAVLQVIQNMRQKSPFSGDD